MKLRQGTFSFLPDLTDSEIHTQVQYCIDNGWAVSVEYTDDPHPRNTYWEMWGHPMFDNPDAAAVVFEVNEPGFHVSREEVKGRSIRYSIKSYATNKPVGRRY